MPATIKDIAILAGVSHMTVSRALNNSKLVSTETRQLILEIAKQLNYQINYNAKSLVLNKSYNIGVFFTSLAADTSDSFLSSCLRAIAGELPDEYNLVVKQMQPFNAETINLQRYDGIIIISQREEDEEIINKVANSNFPLVVMNRKTLSDTVNIYADEVSGVKLATSYLIEKGHRELLILNGPENIQSSRDRYEGFCQAIKEASHTIKTANHNCNEFSLNSGYLSLKEYLTLNSCPSAIFAANDEIAIGAIKALLERNISVPEKCAVIGFNNISLSNFFSPTLTTVNKPIVEMAQKACNLLLQQIEGTDCPKETKLETSLVIRESA